MPTRSAGASAAAAPATTASSSAASAPFGTTQSTSSARWVGSGSPRTRPTTTSRTVAGTSSPGAASASVT